VSSHGVEVARRTANSSAALAIAEVMQAGNLHFMPTFMSDTQMVLPIEKVVYYAQEICVVIATGEIKIRRFVAVDDCGHIINPMIVEGQIEGGLTMGLAPAMFEEIVYDDNGQNLTGTLADYLVPTAVESPKWELGKTITPSPHHPLGAKGVGESPTVGAPPAIANAIVDAMWHLGVRHLDIPITPQKVWRVLRKHGVTD